MDNDILVSAVIGATLIQRVKAVPLNEDAIFEAEFESGADMPYQKELEKILPKE